MPDDLHNIAKYIIRVIDDKINPEFGLTVIMGAELEFGAIPQVMLPVDPINPLRLPREKEWDYACNTL